VLKLAKIKEFPKVQVWILNVISRPLLNGPLNFRIKWKDGWILGLKPLHELDETLQLQQIQYCCFDGLWNYTRSHSSYDRLLLQGLFRRRPGTTQKIENTLFKKNKKKTKKQKTKTKTKKQN
jgi:hypothetical protein